MIALAISETLGSNKEYEYTDALFECFGKDARRRFDRISSKDSYVRSLRGLICLKSLTDKFLSPNADMTILYGEMGKPYFKNNERAFNISHSGTLAAAALVTDGNYPVGIDIEEINTSRNIKQIAKRFFLDKEIKQFSAEGYSLESFYTLWTAKEAYVKLCGKSLATSIRELDVLSIQDRGEVSFVRFFLTHNDNNYILTVASPIQTDVKITDIPKDIKISKR